MELKQCESNVATALCLPQWSACYLRFLPKWDAPVYLSAYCNAPEHMTNIIQRMIQQVGEVSVLSKISTMYIHR